MNSIEELKNLYNKAVDELLSSGIDIERPQYFKIMYACYVKMYKEVPHIIDSSYDDEYRGLDPDLGSQNEIDVVKTVKVISEKFKDQCVVIRSVDASVIIIDRGILTVDEASISGVYYKEFFPQELLNCIVYIESKEDIRYMNYVTSSGSGFSTTRLEVRKQEVDVNINYNDDLPYETIINFINGKSSGIMIWHGTPGTGNFIKICA